jgi:AAA15 family ATPase/GTPase
VIKTRCNPYLSRLSKNFVLFSWDATDNEFVQKVFPQIHRISIRPNPREPGQVQIVVWNEDPKKERIDLVVPLEECGTGLGQVLAILYVVLTADIGKAIIIDEPNSFLHPWRIR